MTKGGCGRALGKSVQVVQSPGWGVWSGWVAGGGKVGYHRPDQDKGGRSVGGQGVQSRVARVARLSPGPGQTSAHRKSNHRHRIESFTLNIN